MKLKKPIAFILFMLGFYGLHASSPANIKQFINHKDWNFVENKGQLIDDNSTPYPRPRISRDRQRGTASNNRVAYYGHQGGIYLYCQPGKISFVFTKIEKNEKISEGTGATEGESALSPAACPDLFGGGGRGRKSEIKDPKITTSRADLILLNSNPSAQIIASDQQKYYENYYTSGNADSGITNVHTFKTITYKDIYPHIDLVLHAKPNGMKYEFVVYPGGDVNDIQMQWNGLESIKKFKDSKIEYSCLLGKIDEDKPVSFQGDNSVISDFKISDNRIGFNVGRYDKTKTLVIDPTLEWGTYFGGSAEDVGNGIAADESGNVYIAGHSLSTSRIATNGAYQTSIASGPGNIDAYLAKFSSDGKIQWATYYGDTCSANAVAIDLAGNVYLTGYTSAISGIATNGAYQTSYGGDVPGTQGDAFLVKFNGKGNRLWGTYFGGKGSEAGYGIATDAFGDVYITGVTNSASGIATKGAYRTNFGSSANSDDDAFLAKFNGSGIIQWATYYGYDPNKSGFSGSTQGSSITTDYLGNVYMVGTTESGSGIATTGAFQTTHSGSTFVEDGFLAKFNAAGSIQWATYYGGFTEIIAAATDISGNVYIVGATDDDSLATVGSYQTNNAGGNDAFLAKFNSTGEELWSTYYGGSSYDIATGIAISKFNDIYITGYTQSSSGIATNGAYQSFFKTSPSNNIDGFLSKFSKDGMREWATYYGYGIRAFGVCADTQENAFISGWTFDGDSGISTSGAYQPSYGGGIQDAFLAKFSFESENDAGIQSILSPKNNVCDDSQAVTFLLHNYGIDELDSVGIALSVNNKLQIVYHWKGKLLSDSFISIKLTKLLFVPGKNSIKVWTSNPNGFNDSIPQNDTSSIIINVIPLPQVNTGLAKTICEDSVVTIGAASVNGYSYSWTSNPSGFSSTVSKPYVNPTKTTTYHLTVTDNTTGCINSDSVVISVNPAPPVNLSASDTICAGNSTLIGVTASKAYSYIWFSNPAGFSSTTSETTVSPGKSTAYTLFVTNVKTGCSNAKSINITVNPLPVPKIDSTHFTICTGSHIRIGGNPETGMAYAWTSIPPGFTSKLSGPVVNPGNDITYFLTETNMNTGCSSSDSAKVIVTVPKAPVSSPGFNQTVCFGTIAVVGGDPIPGLTYSWVSDPSGFVSSSPKSVVKPDTTTTYYLTVKNSIGCTDLAALTVLVNPLPIVKAGLPQMICAGTAIQLGSSTVSGDIYSWTSSPSGFNSKISNPIDSPDVTTKYYLNESIVTTGCADSDSVKITVIPRPNVQFDVKDLNGFEYQFTAQNPNYPSWQYHWIFGDSASGKTDTASGFTVSHTYTQNGKYKVVLTVALPGYCTETEIYDLVINESFSLNIFPNPFETQTDINYTLVNPGHVRISVVDEIGRQLGVLVDKQLNRGEYNTYFNAAFWKTRPAMYFVLFQLDDKVIVKKIIQLDSIYH